MAPRGTNNRKILGLEGSRAGNLRETSLIGTNQQATPRFTGGAGGQFRGAGVSGSFDRTPLPLAGGKTDIGGASTLEFESRQQISPETKSKFTQSPGFFEQDRPELSNKQLAELRKQGVDTSVGTELGVKPTPEGVEKKVAGGTQRGRATLTAFDPKTGKTTTTRSEDIQDQLKRVRELKPGESIGNFRISQGDVQAPSKFKSTKEILRGISKAQNQSAIQKGKRADVKARTDKLKALGTIRAEIAESDFDSPLIKTLDAQIEALLGEAVGGTAQTDQAALAKVSQRFPNIKDNQLLIDILRFTQGE